jgi:uncharacterized membrane protein YedE/YeeE
MRDQLPWYLAGPAVGLAIVLLLAAGNRRFGITGGLTDALSGLVTWRVWLIAGVAAGSLLHALAAGGLQYDKPYGWLDGKLSAGGLAIVLFAAGGLVGFGARTAGGCTSGHGLTGVALGQRASFAAIAAIMGSAIAASLVLEALL